MMWFGGGPFYHGWYGFGGMIMMFLVFFVVIAGLIFAIRWVSGNGCGFHYKTKNDTEPIEILKRRFASGEITKEEFEEAKKHLL